MDRMEEDRVAIARWIQLLSIENRRDEALLGLVTMYMVPGLNRMLCADPHTLAILIEEIRSVHAAMDPPTLTIQHSWRVCKALFLVQTIASFRRTRKPFFEARVIEAIYPILKNCSSGALHYEQLRISALKVIGGTMSEGDVRSVMSVLHTCPLPIIMHVMRRGSYKTKRMATLILWRILMEKVGWSYIKMMHRRTAAVKSALISLNSATSRSGELKRLQRNCWFRVTHPFNTGHKRRRVM